MLSPDMTNDCWVDGLATIICENENAETTAQGTISSEISWVLYNDGILEINGSGTMPDWTAENRPDWDAYKNVVSNVIVSGNITTVGDYAFYEYRNLKTLIIPKTVVEIGDYAAYGCNKLILLGTPRESALSKIGAYAFCNCESLRSCCSGVENLEVIGESAFFDCFALEFVNLRGVNSLGRKSFCNAKIKTMELNGEIDAIPEATFFACELTNLTLPYGVMRIGEWAFSSCDDLLSVAIPVTVVSIGHNAFNPNVPDVYYSGSEELWTFVDSVTDNQMSFVLRQSSIHFNATILSSGDCNEQVSYSLDSNGTLLIQGEGACPDYDPRWYGTQTPWHSYSQDIKCVVISDGIESLGRNMFYNCVNLESLIIYDSEEYSNLDWYDFGEQSNLHDIFIVGNEGTFVYSEWESNPIPNVSYHFLSHY